MKNYKYTILFFLLVMFLLYIVLQVALENKRCEDRGGAFVRTFAGYSCVGEVAK